MKLYFQPLMKEKTSIVTDSHFLFLMQHATLLGLKDAGLITQIQYREAEKVLLQQYKSDIGHNCPENPRDD